MIWRRVFLEPLVNGFIWQQQQDLFVVILGAQDHNCGALVCRAYHDVLSVLERRKGKALRFREIVSLPDAVLTMHRQSFPQGCVKHIGKHIDFRGVRAFGRVPIWLTSLRSALKSRLFRTRHVWFVREVVMQAQLFGKSHADQRWVLKRLTRSAVGQKVSPFCRRESSAERGLMKTGWSPFFLSIAGQSFQLGFPRDRRSWAFSWRCNCSATNKLSRWLLFRPPRTTVPLTAF